MRIALFDALDSSIYELRWFTLFLLYKFGKHAATKVRVLGKLSDVGNGLPAAPSRWRENGNNGRARDGPPENARAAIQNNCRSLLRYEPLG